MLIAAALLGVLWIGVIAVVAGLCASAAHGDRALARARVRGLHVAAAQHVAHRAQQQLEVQPERPVGDVEVVDADHLAASARESPSTCHGPVIPGVRCRRLRSSPSTSASSSITSGRGPTRLISPRRTLNSCGSSSSDVRAQEARRRASRAGRRLILNMPSPTSLSARSSSFRSSASTTIERNLKIRKCRPSRPTRTWRKKTGPLESSRIASAIAAISGPTASSPIDGRDEVERSLEQPRGARQPERADAEHRHAVDVLELDGRADDLEHARQHAHVHAGRLGDPDQLGDAARVDRRRRDDDAVHLQLVDDAPDALGPLERSSTSSPSSGSVAATTARAWLLASFSRIRSASRGSPMTRQRSTGDTGPASERADMRPPMIATKLTTHSAAIWSAPRCPSIRSGWRIVTRQRVEAGQLREQRHLVERRVHEPQLIAVVEAGDLEERTTSGMPTSVASPGRSLPSRLSTSTARRSRRSRRPAPSSRRCSASRREERRDRALARRSTRPMRRRRAARPRPSPRAQPALPSRRHRGSWIVSLAASCGVMSVPGSDELRPHRSRTAAPDQRRAP